MPISVSRLQPTLNLSERALIILREAVVSGELRPGEIHSAKVIAQQMGVSVSPVREALITLVNEGVLAPVRNRGYVVLPVTREDLQDIMQVRLLLEVPTIASLVEKDLTGHESRLRGLLSEMMDAIDESNLNLFLTLDRDFHLSLLEIAGNSHIVEIVSNLRNRTRLYGLSTLADQGSLVNTNREHEGILEAILKKDRNDVHSLMTAHLRHITTDWSDST